jgi:DNA primase
MPANSPRINLGKIVSQYLPVTVSAPCPFHDCATDDLKLIVDIRAQTWRCVECGAGGDAIDFIAQFERRDREDVKRLLRGLGS